MTAAFVGFTYAQGSSATAPVPVTSTIASSHYVVVLVQFQAQSTGAASGITVSDGVGGVYTNPAPSAGDSGGFQQNYYFWVNPSPAGGSMTITVTPGSSSSFSNLNVWVLELSGVSAFDAAAALTTGTSASPTSNAVTTAAAGDFVLAAFYSGAQGYAAAGGATQIDSEVFGTCGVQYEVVGAAGAYTQSATFNSSDTFLAMTLAFLASPPIPPGTVRAGAYHYSMVGAAWYGRQMAAAGSGWFADSAMVPPQMPGTAAITETIVAPSDAVVRAVSAARGISEATSASDAVARVVANLGAPLRRCLPLTWLYEALRFFVPFLSRCLSLTRLPV